MIAFLSLGILLLWSNVLSKKGKLFQLIQGPLVAVVVGIIYVLFLGENSMWQIKAEQLVSVPVPSDLNSFFGQFSFPNFGEITVCPYRDCASTYVRRTHMCTASTARGFP